MILVLIILVFNVGISFIASRVYPSHCVRPSKVPVDIQEMSIEELEEPRQLFVQVDTPLVPLAEKDIIVRSAYLNTRRGAQHSEYQNSTIILLEVKKSILDEKALEKCGVGGHVSAKFEVTTEDVSFFSVSNNAFVCFSQVVPIGEERGGMYTHVQALLYCYDVTVTHLEVAWVAYKKTLFGEEYTFRANAERPILLNKKADVEGGIVVCAAMLPHYTPFVEDWVRYQKTIGVDHVHLALESRFLNHGGFEPKFLQAAVEESYLSVEFWHRWLNETDICDHSLDLALYGCILQFQNIYSYIMLGDPRDFFVPRDSTLPHLQNYVSYWCPTTHCQFKWKNLLYKECKKAGTDGNITNTVPVTNVSAKEKMFTIYKSSLIVHSSGLFSSGGKSDVPVEKAYFAHFGKSINSSDIRILPITEKC